MSKVTINLDEFNNTCGDGCCLDYGIVTTVNGTELPFHNMDVQTILQGVLEHLGYEVEITFSYNGEQQY